MTHFGHYWARWMLLAFIACGVAGMHSLGHPHEATAAISHSGSHVMAADHDTIVDSAKVSSTHVPLGPMCLAVMSAGLLLVSLMATRSRPAQVPSPNRRPPHTTAAARGPPDPEPTGVTLARITVLRI